MDRYYLAIPAFQNWVGNLGQWHWRINFPRWATTQFLYDAARLIGEYDGAGTSDKRRLYADERGSVIAVEAAGGVTKNTYDAYGVPGAGNVGRFQYTGQAWLAEVSLYHYKARAYAPLLGRFLQTDPIGYADQMNLYAYVRNDPVNGVDPAGRESYWGSRQLVENGSFAVHMYVAVVDDETGGITLYSAGPRDEPTTAEGAAQYVSRYQYLQRYDSTADTFQNDMAHATSRLSSDNPNSGHDFVPLPDGISDETLRAVGDAAIGHPDYDAASGNGANSNSFAESIIQRAAELSGVKLGFWNRPLGNAPMADKWRRVLYDENKLKRAAEIAKAE